jgi:hypothetical protein
MDFKLVSYTFFARESHWTYCASHINLSPFTVPDTICCCSSSSSLIAPIVNNDSTLNYHKVSHSHFNYQWKNSIALPYLGFEPKTFGFPVGIATNEPLR